MTTQDMTILYEDEDIVAIDKPSGILVHTDGKGTSSTGTVVDWFLSRYPGSHVVGEEPIETQNGFIIDRPGIVHRLDRDTSGVLLLAKTDAGHACLKSQFQNHTIEKTYHAWVYGMLKHDTYHITAAIGRSKTFGRWTAISKSVRGMAREAETHITALERFPGDPALGGGYTYVQARPTTGRTHQIRVHLQYSNYPVVADSLYAGKRTGVEHDLGFTRHALHAYQIIFQTVDGDVVTVVSPEPDDFVRARHHVG